MDKASKDHVAGALLLALGVAVAIAGAGYGLGSLRQMGPGFFPTVLGFLRRAPVIGPLLDTPGVKRALNRVAPAQSLPM